MRTFNKTIGSSLVVDTGLLIEFLSASEHGKKIDEMIFKNEFIASVLISPLTLVEIYYLTRRKSSMQRAKETINKIKNLITIAPLEEYLELLGEIKALTAFSLADSANIALAEYKNISVIFKHEQEIDNRLKQSTETPFASRIVFIDDFSHFQDKS